MNRAAAGAIAGVVAAGVGLASAEVAALLVGPDASPLVAVGAVVIDNAPESVVRFGITVFGSHDKTALLLGTILILAGAAAVLGALGAWRLWLGLAGLAGFTVIGTAAAVSRPDASVTAPIPTLVAGLAAALTFLALRDRVDAVARVGTAPDQRPAAAGPPTPDRPTPTGGPAPGPPTTAGGSAAERPTPTGESTPDESTPDEPAPDESTPDESTPDEPAPAGRPAPERPTPPATADDRGPAGTAAPGRRSFLRLASLLLGGAAVVGFGGHWLGQRREVDATRASITLPTPVDPAPPVPAGVDPPVPGLTGYVTDNRRFYRIDTALVVPRVDPDDWRLLIHGRVRRPYEISFAELLARPMIERYITLTCVSNPVGGDLIGNARWLGVPVRELVAAAEPLPGADQVVSRSVDGWTCGTPTEALTDGRDALLAVGMNGEPLPLEHGFPVRMVVPGLYGYVSACKWITELELTSFDDYDAYWVRRGWAPRGPVKTQSRIDTPRRRAAAGEVIVAGVAWAQHRGIARVEVQVDGGPWQEATLADAVSSDTWRQWWWRWQATAGTHRLTVRATDSTGAVQPAEPTPVAPDGATGWHTVEVEVS